MGYYTRDELKEIESKIMETSKFKFIVDEQRKHNREYIGMTLGDEKLECGWFETVIEGTFQGQKVKLYFDGPQVRELTGNLNVLRVAEGSVKYFYTH